MKGLSFDQFMFEPIKNPKNTPLKNQSREEKKGRKS